MHLLSRSFVFTWLFFLFTNAFLTFFNEMSCFFCSLGKVFVAVWHFVVEYICLLTLLWLSLWEEVVLHPFPTHSVQVLGLYERIFDRMCRFANYARIIDRFRCGDNFAYTRLSIICYARSRKVRSAHSFSSSRKSESDFVLS